MQCSLCRDDDGFFRLDDSAGQSPAARATGSGDRSCGIPLGCRMQSTRAAPTPPSGPLSANLLMPSASRRSSASRRRATPAEWRRPVFLAAFSADRASQVAGRADRRSFPPDPEPDGVVGAFIASDPAPVCLPEPLALPGVSGRRSRLGPAIFCAPDLSGDQQASGRLATPAARPPDAETRHETQTGSRFPVHDTDYLSLSRSLAHLPARNYNGPKRAREAGRRERHRRPDAYARRSEGRRVHHALSPPPLASTRGPRSGNGARKRCRTAPSLLVPVPRSAVERLRQ